MNIFSICTCVTNAMKYKLLININNSSQTMQSRIRNATFDIVITLRYSTASVAFCFWRVNLNSAKI